MPTRFHVVEYPVSGGSHRSEGDDQYKGDDDDDDDDGDDDDDLSGPRGRTCRKAMTVRRLVKQLREQTVTTLSFSRSVRSSSKYDVPRITTTS
jgi:hypothetical protein